MHLPLVHRRIEAFARRIRARNELAREPAFRQVSRRSVRVRLGFRGVLRSRSSMDVRCSRARNGEAKRKGTFHFAASFPSRVKRGHGVRYLLPLVFRIFRSVHCHQNEAARRTCQVPLSDASPRNTSVPLTSSLWADTSVRNEANRPCFLLFHYLPSVTVIFESPAGIF